MRPIWVVTVKRRKVYLGIVLALFLTFVLVGGFGGQDKEIWSWTLGDRVVLIDAGHGGVDPGAVGISKVLEKDVTLAVSKRLQALIQQSGAKSIMVRVEDRDLGSSQGLAKRKREDLAQRIQLAMDTQAEVYLSIHANSFPDAKLTGAQTFYHADSPEGKLLAQSIQQELNIMTKGKRVIKGNQDIYVLKKANQAAVTVELGFLSNLEEEQLLTTPEYQQQLAVAIYKGLTVYFSKQFEGSKNP
ncbi:N-acetylmuramoyl-L-alanine amidase [Desulfosporosinus sp. BICA1-9]|uniref:N-acetylmuramoyl-L-alanine amidase n=1 Tax=Desulfosporosinus sp. BICA1-9 TaxID=1531958 RepID=UPI00054C2F04|nr:N-acetylmuramoyl-L-alanine amidase [Desulfosporosinus sp. BICA1-9]KJS50686.1 MAG: N-acetylmuramoyl-L-alanine amidase [Peptococcaceae bacterium BRH_c23]KJS78697.1 MAG: N-acetylmuramoyl-L-alanine amidase [Desulfosporosinus sp. BICA1-9]HBW36023.1 N-acetylmuramoyl-L-alanine amidase [Desulfosporosinus sp.]